MSRTMPVKSAVSSGWKTIAALPELLSSSVISSVTAAVDIANSRLSAGALSLRLPVRMSKRPIGYAGTPCSWRSRRDSASMRFSIGGCVEKRLPIALPAPGGKM